MRKREVKKRSWSLSDLNVTTAPAATVLMSGTSWKPTAKRESVFLQFRPSCNTTAPFFRENHLSYKYQRRCHSSLRTWDFLGGEAESSSEDEEMEGHVPSAVAPPPRKRRRVKLSVSAHPVVAVPAKVRRKNRREEKKRRKEKKKGEKKKTWHHWRRSWTFPLPPRLLVQAL